MATSSYRTESSGTICQNEIQRVDITVLLNGMALEQPAPTESIVESSYRKEKHVLAGTLQTSVDTNLCHGFENDQTQQVYQEGCEGQVCACDRTRKTPSSLHLHMTRLVSVNTDLASPCSDYDIDSPVNGGYPDFSDSGQTGIRCSRKGAEPDSGECDLPDSTPSSISSIGLNGINFKRQFSLHLVRLASFSSCSSYSNSDKCVDGGIHSSGTDFELDTVLCSPRLGTDCQDFRHVSNDQLLLFLENIVEQCRYSGRYVWNELHPKVSGSDSLYREGKEFQVLSSYKESLFTVDSEVLLCRDNGSQKQFILKKIYNINTRLIGTEFLTKHNNQDFLPKIYGIYRDKYFIWIFQEYIPGNLAKCDWNLVQVRQFAECLMAICKYLHEHDLAHCDIKLGNLRVRDTSDPRSVVIIDFQSAKHPDQRPLPVGGFTVTYLPPWHEQFEKVPVFNPILKTTDLWAAACVFIYFLLPIDREDLQHYQGIWREQLQDIHKNCRQICECKVNVRLYLKEHGHEILSIHLGHMMTSHEENANWLVLRRLLEYLTDCNNVSDKTADTALQLIQGKQHPPKLVSVPKRSFDHDNHLHQA